MISYVENYDPNDSPALHEAYGYAAGLSTCVLVWAILHHLYFYHMQRVGMRLRVAVVVPGPPRHAAHRAARS